jgi:hypothetical protein
MNEQSCFSFAAIPRRPNSLRSSFFASMINQLTLNMVAISNFMGIHSINACRLYPVIR